MLGFLIKTDRLTYQIQRETARMWRERLGLNDKNVWTPKLYKRHKQLVRNEAARRGREVLEFQVQDGWNPLCKFLKKSSPDVPFPHLKDQREMMTIKIIVVIRGLLAWTALVGSLYAGVRFGKESL